MKSNNRVKNKLDIDSSVDDKFYKYYAEQSISKSTIERFLGIQSAVMRTLKKLQKKEKNLDVLDVGCNAGTQCIIWAEQDHHVYGVDVNNNLLDLAMSRTKDRHLHVDYRIGSASDIPWSDSSMDVCLVPELLEHVPEWEKCIDEFARVLRPGGILYISTTNKLCPKQQEFDLPFYSWYPKYLKKHYEELSITTRPELVCHAEFPAVNWFTFYSLKAELLKRGLTSYDRFDIVNIERMNGLVKILVLVIRKIPIARWLAHVLTPYTVVLAVKHG